MGQVSWGVEGVYPKAVCVFEGFGDVRARQLAELGVSADEAQLDMRGMRMATHVEGEVLVPRRGVIPLVMERVDRFRTGDDVGHLVRQIREAMPGDDIAPLLGVVGSIRCPVGALWVSSALLVSTYRPGRCKRG